MSAQVASAEGALGNLRTILLIPTLDGELRQAALGKAEPAEVFDRLRRVLQELPEDERERLSLAAERIDAPRLAITHPPTPYRVELIATRGAREAQVRLDGARAEAVAAELRTLEPAIAEDVLDLHRSALYT